MQFAKIQSDIFTETRALQSLLTLFSVGKPTHFALARQRPLFTYTMQQCPALLNQSSSPQHLLRAWTQPLQTHRRRSGRAEFLMLFSRFLAGV